MLEKELWTIKYAPKKESDIVGNPNAVKVIKEFLTKWSSKNEIKALLLLGPPGCGKTSSTNVLAKLNRFDVIEINASDVRNKKSIEEKLIPSLATRTIKKGVNKLYLIDEVDGLSGNQDRGGLSAMLKMVKLSKFPIIFTANNVHDKKFRSLRDKRSGIKIVKFQKIKNPTIVKVLQKICIAEKIQADPKALTEIAINVNNDLRSAINDLQAVCEGKKKLTLSDVRKIQQVRDTEKNIFEVLNIIFKNKDIQTCNRAVSMLDIDWGLLLHWVNEILPYHKVSSRTLFKSYKALSKADLIYNAIASNPEKISWSMLPYFIDIISSGVSLPIKNENKSHFVQYFRYSPSNFLNKMYASRSGELMNIVNKIRKKLKSSPEEIITKHLPFIALILKKRSPQSEYLKKFYELDRREITFIKNII